MSSSANRRALRRYARQAPPRICGMCGADFTKLLDPDNHIARHIAERSGMRRDLARKALRARGGI